MKQVSIIMNFSRYRFALFLGVIAMLASCQRPDHHLKRTVPLKAAFKTISTIVEEGPPKKDMITGEGNGIPIGKSSFVTHATFDVNYNLTGNIIVTTENGDKLFANIQGNAPDIDAKGNITLHFESTITGGTENLRMQRAAFQASLMKALKLLKDQRHGTELLPIGFQRAGN
jgi:hypothetical protein